MKRAISAQMFHWIFILVAGGVILLFFITIVSSVRSSSENKMSISMIENLDAIFSGAQASDNTVSMIPAPPQTSIEFICDRDGYSELAVAGTIAGKQNANRILFAHAEVTGRQFIAFTRGIDIPFKVDNALFLTDRGIRYAVLDSQTQPQFASTVMKLLPSNISKMIVPVSKQGASDLFDAVKPEGVREIVLVVYGQPLMDIGDLAEAKVTQVVVNSNALLRDGTLQYLRTSRGKVVAQEGFHYYFGPTMLLGAIMSENGDYYECAIAKFFEKAEVISQLYAERSRILGDETTYPVCEAVYDESVQAFNDIRDIVTGSGAYSLSLGQLSSRQVTFLSKEGADEGAAFRLADLNEEVELYSCPLLY